MTIASRLTFVSSLLAMHAVTAMAQPSASETCDLNAVVDPLADVEPAVVRPRTRANPLATTARWGGGVRVTGLSGIGALPGVNFGIEVAGLVRRDEYFVELALGRWKPEDTHLVTETPERVELGLDVWTLRGGWASMTMPLRGWLLAEVGEVAGARGMPGVVTRMVMGDTPQQRQWRAVGLGFGVAWPMSDQARLVGNMEFAVPVNRERLLLDGGEAYEPDPLAARYSVGLEVGWR
jgi:hypothetical protein